MKSIVLYDLNEKSHAEQSRIIRTLFGFTDKSNNGKYSYERPGLLSKIPFERKTKTVLIVEKKYEKQVIDQFKKVGVKPTITYSRKKD